MPAPAWVITLGSVAIWTLIITLLVMQYKHMSRPKRYLMHSDLILLDEVPIHGRLRTPATILMNCPMEASWEVNVKVSTDARIYEFSVPRDALMKVARMPKGASWSEADSLMLGNTYKIKGLRQRSLTIMVDLPEDDVNMTIVIPLRKMRRALNQWDDHTPISKNEDMLSETIDMELQKFLSDK